MFDRSSTITYIKTPDSDVKVVNAARISFHKVVDSFTEKDEGLVRYLANHRHFTPFTHCRDTFSFNLMQREIGEFFLFLSQENAAGMVWKMDGERLYVKHSLFGWAELLNKMFCHEKFVWNDHTLTYHFRKVYETLKEKYPASARHLFKFDEKSFVGSRWDNELGVPEAVATDPYFIDHTVCVKTPIFVARQFLKHFIGFTYNEVSRRYVDDQPEFFHPAIWRTRAENKKQGSTDEIAEEMYKEVDGDSMDNLVMNTAYQACADYERLVDKNEYNVCPEQARMTLPQSMMTEFYVTAHMAAWNRFFALRMEEHAQYEIRQCAIPIKECIEAEG